MPRAPKAPVNPDGPAPIAENEYPKAIYGKDGAVRRVNDPDEEAKYVDLGWKTEPWGPPSSANHVFSH